MDVQWLKDNAEFLSSVVGISVGSLALIRRAHKSFIKHLSSHFASKHDLNTSLHKMEARQSVALQRIEERQEEIGGKIEALTTLVWMVQEVVTGTNPGEVEAERSLKKVTQ